MAESTSFPTRLTPSDRLMWTIERDPVLRSPVVVVGLLDRAPAWDALVETLCRAADRIPRFRQRITGSAGVFGGLEWTDAPTFSIGYHVRRVRASEPGDLRAVLDLAAPTASAAFDPARPPWECTLVEGLGDGRAAFILRFHHTMTDGVGGIDLAGDVFDETRAGTTRPDEAVDVPTGRPAPAPWSPLVAAAAAGVRGMTHPNRTATDGARLARSIARMLAPAAPRMSPALVGRSLDRRLDAVERPLSALRDAADAVGGTINEVFLAAVAGALAEYHERVGAPVTALQVTMPISVRAEGDPKGGNRFTPVRFVLPIADRDAEVRAKVVHDITRRWRSEPAVGFTNALASVLDRLPPPLVARIFGGLLKNVDLDLVDVPGLRRPAYLGGAEIERMWAFAPPTGAALSITLLSHVDTCCVAVLSDLAAVSDPSLLTACLGDALDDVAALGSARKAMS